jgi:histidinol-phosphatase (PHP family)
LKKFYPKIDEILKVIIRRGIALEINTSGGDRLMPGEFVIKRYLSLGGYLITLGSDAHVPANVGKCFEETVKTLKELQVGELCYYKKRKRIQYRI